MSSYAEGERVNKQAHSDPKNGGHEFAGVEAVADKHTRDCGDELIERQPESVEISKPKVSASYFRAERSDVADVGVRVAKCIRKKECAEQPRNRGDHQQQQPELETLKHRG